MPELTPFQQKAQQLKAKNDEQRKFWDDRFKSIAEAKAKDPNAPDDPPLTADEETYLKKVYGELQDLNTAVEQFSEYSTVAGKTEALLTVLGQPQGRPDFPNTDPRDNRPMKSAGREFIDAPEIKSWSENVLGLKGPGSQVANGIRIDSPAVEVKGLIITANNSGGAFVRRDYYPYVDLPLRPLTIRDVITTARTGSNLVEYVRVTALTRAAAVVPEATHTSGAGYTAAAKPESGAAFEIVQAGVKTIAVWMPVTRQILSDAPMLESMIDSFERQDLELALEEQIISGTGGTNFTGLENTPGLTPQAFDTDLITTTRKARTKALVVGRAKSTAYLLNPYDWETLDLTKQTNGVFYFGGPMVMGTPQLWGLPVVESEVVPQGTGYTGDLRQMIVWDREQATRRITDSHADFFTHNLIAILTELRAAFGVLRPAAIVKMDFVTGANS